jgi:hypothetical protein
MFRKTLLFALTAGVLLTGGWACEKLGKFGMKSNANAVSDTQVVATVGGKDITFGDWMRQLDLLRVMVPEGRGLDPTDARQVKQALETLISQQIVLAALRKTNYTDPTFDASVQKRLVQAELQLKEDKEQLERDMKAIDRLEKNYKEPLKEYLLAQNFASNQRNSVVVTEKDIRDRYDLYAQKYKQAGKKVPPYNPQVKDIIKAELQAGKLMKSLEEGVKVSRKDDVITKYLTGLSPSREMLGSPAAEPAADAKDTQELKKK